MSGIGAIPCTRLRGGVLFCRINTVTLVASAPDPETCSDRSVFAHAAGRSIGIPFSRVHPGTFQESGGHARASRNSAGARDRLGRPVGEAFVHSPGGRGEAALFDGPRGDVE